MRKSNFVKNTSLALISTGLFCSLAVNTLAKSPENYLDMDSIVEGNVEDFVPKSFGIIYPKQATRTSEDTFYIAGTSDPDQPLYINDQEIVDRASNGIFEVVLSVPQDGVYKCVFRQGDVTKTVPIFKNIEPTSSYDDFILKKINLKNEFVIDSKVFPSQNIITYDKKVKLSCAAPSGSIVKAEVLGKTVDLKQERNTAEEGISAVYSVEVDLSASLDDDKTYDIGRITYKCEYKGDITEKTSVGKIYYSNRLPAFARVSWGYGILRSGPDSSESEIVSVLKKGVVDRVIQENGEFYQLGCGRWIGKKFVEPLFESIDLNNHITEVRFSRDSKSEILTLKGTCAPVFTSGIVGDKLIINLSSTDGNLDFSSLSGKSDLFEEVVAENKSGYLELVFNLKSEDILWGYNIEFDENITSICLKKRPKLSEDSSKPLKDVTVLVDAGHGGSDPGAIGLIGEIGGGTEKNINLANALAVKNRLVSLGANVVMTRDEDKYVSLSDRATLIEKTKADFVIVIHANVGTNIKSEGVIVYYANDNRFSKPFSSLVADVISEYAERNNGKMEIMDFYVSKNTFCPTAFIEAGFLTNLTDAAQLFTSERVFDLANAVGDSIIKYLSE